MTSLTMLAYAYARLSCFTCTVVDQIDVVSRVVESASLDNLTLVEITAAALTITCALEIP